MAASHGVSTKVHSLVKGATRLNRSTIHEFGLPESSRILFCWIPAGDCPSGPPLGSFAATKGVVPMELAKKWNEKTEAYKKGTPLAGFIEFQGGKNFEVSFEGPPIEWLVRQAAGASTDHPSCMPDIASCLPANPIGMESIYNKELAFHESFIQRWHKSNTEKRQTDGIITLKHCYHIANAKLQENKYKYSGLTLPQMVQKVINKAHDCGIEVTSEKNIKPEDYSKIMENIKFRDEMERLAALKAAEEEAEMRRKIAKERKAAMNK